MKGKWHGAPYHDYVNKKWLITLELETAPEIYDQTKDADLSLEIKKWREKRSLNANAYFHVLIGKIAAEMNISHQESHNLMIARYGEVDSEVKNIIMADEIPWMKLETIHLRPTSHAKTMENGKVYRIFEVMRGSHTYDTKEMSVLIDGVVSEAKAMGIETLPPDELERMKATWEKRKA